VNLRSTKLGRLSPVSQAPPLGAGAPWRLPPFCQRADAEVKQLGHGQSEEIRDSS
jgi:hypothetical protein